MEGKESGKVAKLKVGVQDAKVSTVKTDIVNTPTPTHPPKPNAVEIVTELATPPTRLKGRHLAQHGARNVTLAGKRVLSRSAAKVGKDNLQPTMRSQRVRHVCGRLGWHHDDDG